VCEITQSLEKCSATAIKQVLAHQLAEEVKQKKMTKIEMDARM
jgi:hypothetical protein